MLWPGRLLSWRGLQSPALSPPASCLRFHQAERPWGPQPRGPFICWSYVIRNSWSLSAMWTIRTWCGSRRSRRKLSACLPGEGRGMVAGGTGTARLLWPWGHSSPPPHLIGKTDGLPGGSLLNAQLSITGRGKRGGGLGLGMGLHMLCLATSFLCRVSGRKPRVPGKGLAHGLEELSWCWLHQLDLSLPGNGQGLGWVGKGPVVPRPPQQCPACAKQRIQQRA